MTETVLASLATGLGLSLIIALLALRRESLSPSGAAGAVLVGTLIFGLGGWVWGVLLVLFFLSSSLLSHYKESDKAAVAEKFDKGHRRDFVQVLANGGAGAVIALLSAVVPHGVPDSLWFALFTGVMATVTADTWATELGTLGRAAPRLITSGRPVEVGTSGAISLLGTSVAMAGSLLIGLAAGVLGAFAGLFPWGVALTVTVIGAISGLAGSMVDSLLGATVQRIYYCDACGKETERKVHRCGATTRPLRGARWMTNDMVNFLSSLDGGLVAAALAVLLL